jgi:hypothetical protein
MTPRSQPCKPQEIKGSPLLGGHNQPRYQSLRDIRIYRDLVFQVGVRSRADEIALLKIIVAISKEVQTR